MYRCGVCGDVVGPRVARKVRIVSRVVQGKANRLPRKEIAREIPVCPDCDNVTEARANRQVLRISQPVDF